MKLLEILQLFKYVLGVEFDIREMALRLIRRSVLRNQGIGGVMTYGLRATIDIVTQLLTDQSNDERQVERNVI